MVSRIESRPGVSITGDELSKVDTFLIRSEPGLLGQRNISISRALLRRPMCLYAKAKR